MQTSYRNIAAGSIAVLCSVFLMPLAHAQDTVAGSETSEEAEPLVTDRPDFTESAQTVPVGRVQVEGGYTFVRNGQDGEHSYGEVLVRVPVSRKAEVRIGLPSYTRQRGPSGGASGWSDSFLGAKFVLSEGGDQTGFRKPKMAVLVGSSLPTGSRAFREDKFQPEAVFLASVDLSEKTGLSSNIGISRASDVGTRYNQVFGSVSIGHGLSERLGAFVEVFGFSDTSAAGDSARYFDTGLTYLFNNDRQVDVRAGVGLNNDIPGSDYFLGIGLSQRF